MADNKKYFLDFGGLQSLWNKMKGTFAGKIDTENAISDINNNLETILNMVLAVSPKVVDNYSAALLAAPSVAPGIAIKVKNAETVNDEVKPAGIYLIEDTDPVSIIYVGSSNSNINNSQLAEIISKIAVLEASAIKNVKISDGTSDLDTYELTDNTLIVIHDDVVDINSDSIHALTHRAVAAKFKELSDKITKLPTFKIAVVDSLPTDSISLSTIYLVKNSNAADNNLYTEYIRVYDSNSNLVWEKLGEHNIAATGGVTTEQLNNAISNALKNYVTTANLEAALAAQKAEIKDELSKTFATEDSILDSIQTGKIGETIMITDEQIKSLL
jgi:hypothetical protein